jgi:hypothetical protein
MHACFPSPSLNGDFANKTIVTPAGFESSRLIATIPVCASHEPGLIAQSNVLACKDVVS